MFNLRSKSAGLLEVDIYDEIGSNTISSDDIRKLLKDSADAKEIVVRINSAGGSVTEGLAIYNLLVSHPAKVTVQIDAVAASIASIIAMAGDRVCMHEDSFFMIHDPFAAGIKGGADELRSTADLLDKIKNSMVRIYSTKCNWEEDKIRQAMDDETWLTANEALAAGFITEIINKDKARAFSGDLKLFAKAPLDKIHQKVENAMDEEHKKKMDELCEKMDKHLADYSDFKKKFEDKFPPEKKKEEEESDEDSDSDSDEDEDEEEDMKDVDKKTLQALADANKAVQALSEKLVAVEKKEHETAVSAAIAQGKLIPALKDWALGQDSKSIGAYLVAVGDAKFPLSQEHKEDKEAASKKDGEVELTKEEILVAQQMGHKLEDVKAYKKSHNIK